MYCLIKCIVQGKQARVKKGKSASPILNVLIFLCTPNDGVSILITCSDYEIVLTFMSHGSDLL